VKKGEKDLPGLTDEEKPRMRGPKRASKVRHYLASVIDI
jgi:small subunit ribosomal protein S6e